MRTATRVAEGLSALVLVLLGASNPHHGISLYLVAGIEAITAAFVASTFPRKRSPIVALVLTVGVLITMSSGLFGGDGNAGLHSPVMGFSALPLLVLLLSQIVAAIGAIAAFFGRGNGTART